MEVSLTERKVKSTTDTSAVATRKAIPVNLPFVTGKTSPTALAAPVVEGIVLMRRRAPAAPIFFRRAVHGLLSGGIGMDGGHQTGFNADAFLNKT